MTELGRSVDPFQLDLLQRLAGSVREHGFPEGHDSLLDTWDRALKKYEVVLDLTVVDEATHPVALLVYCNEGECCDNDLRCDSLVDDIEVSGSILLILALADTVNLVVDTGTVMVTHLTSTRNRPLDVGRMPGTDTSNLAQTFVCLSRELLGTPS